MIMIKRFISLENLTTMRDNNLGYSHIITLLYTPQFEGLVIEGYFEFREELANKVSAWSYLVICCISITFWLMFFP